MPTCTDNIVRGSPARDREDQISTFVGGQTTYKSVSHGVTDKTAPFIPVPRPS